MKMEFLSLGKPDRHDPPEMVEGKRALPCGLWREQPCQSSLQSCEAASFCRPAPEEPTNWGSQHLTDLEKTKAQL